jgi:hypothetical protein
VDIQTRIGLGAGAFFFLAAIALPFVPWWISVPIMAGCAFVACWGCLPLLSKLPLPVFPQRIPLHIAARRVYEAAERAGDLDLTISSNSAPEAKLNHFKMFLVVDDGAELFGVKPPSTQSRPIPKKEFGKLYPVEGEVSNLCRPSAPNEIAYSNVTIRQSILRRLTKKYLTVYVAEARQLKTRE